MIKEQVPAEQFTDDLERYLIDSITQQTFVDPVITDDGHTYQRKSIEEWLVISRKSPLTNLDLNNPQLRPNILLKGIIQDLNIKKMLTAFRNKNKLNENLKTQLNQRNNQLKILRQQLLVKQKLIQRLQQKDIMMTYFLDIKQSIINSQQKYKKLISFFPRKVQSLRILFKASQHNFRIKQYYRQFRHVFDTIVLCLNQKNRVIGGFIPQTYNRMNKGQYLKNIQNLEFVFSLETKQKFSFIKQAGNQIKISQFFILIYRFFYVQSVFGQYFLSFILSLQ